MNLRHVTDSHYAVWGDETAAFGPPPSPQLPAGAQRFWKYWQLAECDAGVVATHAGELVGFFRFTLYKKVLFAGGTWVAPAFRRRGLAVRMWKMALRKHKPKRVSVNLVTWKGERLAICLRDRGILPNDSITRC